MIGYLISNYFQYLKQDLRKKRFTLKKDRDIEGLTSKAFNDGNVMRYYDQETYVLYRKFYEDTNIIEFEDVMSPISKKKLNVENIITSVNYIERFTSQAAHITKFWKNILTLREVFTVKNSSIHKRQMN